MKILYSHDTIATTFFEDATHLSDNGAFPSVSLNGLRHCLVRVFWKNDLQSGAHLS